MARGDTPIGIITNPNARKNRGDRGRVRRLEALVGAGGLVRETGSVDEIRDVLSEFADRGARYWVSDGGDGTFHWMLNAGQELLAERRAAGRALPEPRLVPTNGGTIDFVAKKARIRGNADAIVKQLVRSVRSESPFPELEMDLLEVTGHRPGEVVPGFRRLGFAAALGGAGQRFFAKYYAEPEPGAATVLRVAAKTATGIVGSLPGLRRLPIVPERLREYAREVITGTRAHVEVDGQAYRYPLLQGLHAGSIDVDLGAVRLFRYAREPGRLHLVVGTMTPLELAWKWAFLALGLNVPGRTWHELAGETMRVRADAGERLDPVIDGELYFGFERLEVRQGPRVTVPAIA